MNDGHQKYENHQAFHSIQALTPFDFHRYCEDTKLSVHRQRKCPRLVDVDTTFINNPNVSVWWGFGHFQTCT